MSVIINGTGGGGTPANPNGSVQFNNGGSFGGFGQWIPGTNTLEIPAADSATPTTATFQFQSVLTGTLNTNGAQANLNGSLSTGIGEPGLINVNVGYTGYDVNKNVTISNSNPAVLTAAVNHNLSGGQTVLLQTTGSLPNGLSTLTTYFVDTNSLTATTFEVAATYNGTPIATTSAGSGTHSYVLGGGVTGIIGNVFWQIANGQPPTGLMHGMPIQLQCTGIFPPPFLANTTYYVGNTLNNSFFTVAATPGGSAIHTTGGFTGTLTYQLQSGGILQNTLPAAVQAFLIGPGALYADDSIPLFNISQIWNTAAQFPTGQAGIAFTISNVRWQSQSTIFSQYQALNTNLNVFNVVAEANGASWALGPAGIGGIGPPLIEFVNSNITVPQVNIVSAPVAGFSLSGGTPGAIPLDGWFNYGGQARAASDFPVTSSAVLVNVTGLTVNVQAGRSYAFDVYLTCTDAAAGGVQAAIGGSCTATNIIYDGWALDNNVIKGQTNAAALGTAVASTLTTSTAGIVIRIKGLITVNAAGTLTVQFAQNTGNITASTVKRGSHFIVQDMP